MKNLLSLLATVLALSACTQQPKNDLQSSSRGDSLVINEFKNFKDEFIEDLWKTYPAWAGSQGYHKYDSVLLIPDEQERNKELAFAGIAEAGLKAYDFSKLDANNKTDYRLIQNFVKGVRFSINEFKNYEWDPSAYNIGESIFQILDNRQMKLDEKLRILTIKLAGASAYFEAAKKNIRKPTREHSLLAVNQNKGSLYFFNSVLEDSLKKSTLNKNDRENFLKNVLAAKNAINNYVDWLQKEVLTMPDSSFRSFRIGKELYAKKFLIDIQSGYSADEMYKKAEERKKLLLLLMSKESAILWNKYFKGKKEPDDERLRIKMIIDTISSQHCRRDEFLKTIENQLPELTTFINAHHIIDLDSTKPLQVRKTPDYAAGVAGAGINSPGPYNKDATTYYNVTPLINYNAADAESYLREYNDYVLRILNIHEAIPGHYTQLIYSNRSPSLIKSIFGNGAMIEGWACYVERMMMEEGYDPSVEMQLFYYKWNLREVCNFLLDYNIQCNNWTEKQVVDLLVNEAFQERKEAEEKWKRATLSQVQLTSYFSGLTEIYELREEIKKKQGDHFDLKKFHGQFLSYGSAPVKEIRELMLNGN